MSQNSSQNPVEETSDQFEATITWQDQNPLLPGRTYLLSFKNQSYKATVTKLKFRLQGDKQEAVNVLHNTETGVVNFSLDNSITFPADASQQPTGFELKDKRSQNIIATGTINHTLRRATNIRWQTLDINQQARANQKQQKPCVVWLTGFSGSGKSTIANLVEKLLYDQGRHSYILDGDNVRHGLNKDLGFTDADRVENIRRIAETAKLMVDAGLIVLTSFISPFRSERQMARELMAEGEFIEVFVNTPLSVCEQRDPKGLYKKVRLGQIKNFTGFDSPYEAPEQAEITIDTTISTPEQAAQTIVNYLTR